WQVVPSLGHEPGHEHEHGSPQQRRAQSAGNPRHGRVDQAPLEEQEHEDRAREERDGGAGEGDEGHGRRRRNHARSRTTSPSRPFGRKIRIRIRTEKAKMSLYSAPNAPPVRSDM